MLSLSLLSTMDFVENRGCINKTYSEYLAKNPKLESEIFQNELNEYFNNVKVLTTTFKSYSQKSNDDKVSDYEAEILKEKYDLELRKGEEQIENLYKNEIDTAEKQRDTVKLSKLLEVKNKKLEDIRKEKTKTLQDAKNELIVEKDNKYTYLSAYIQGRTNVKYYIKDTENGEQYTNFEEVPNIAEYIKDKALYSVKLPFKSTRDGNLAYMSDWFITHKFEGYFIIENQRLTYNKDHIWVYSDLQVKYDEYVSLKEKTIKEGLMAIFALALGLLLILYSLKNKGQGILYIEKVKAVYRKVPLDLRTFILIIYSIYTISYIEEMNFFKRSFSADHVFDLTLIVIFIIYIMFNIKYISTFTNDRAELVAQCKKSIIYELSVIIKEILMTKGVMFKVRIIFILTMILGGVIAIVVITAPVRPFPLFLVLVGCIFLYCFLLLQYILRKTILFNKILKGTEEIAAGNLNYIIEDKGHGDLSKMVNNINNMKEGIKKSVDNEMKSERLKSELITNVSHDLKTPLTSIINYVNLLKKQDISQEERVAYIEVLDRKSQRLKVLIEDLFDASKMSSGSVELNIEKVDVIALLKQAMGEFDEKIKNSSLIFKVNTPSEKVYVNLDGKKTWRVFENLITNILKYSLPNTRVYIDLIEEENKVKIIMKNISAYEMEFDVSEIFERFKRGDKSRSTEGSGLGLAIAKSIVELQGGKMNIEIDGDLFKVSIEFDNRATNKN